MVGFAAMAPMPIDLSDRIEDPELRTVEEDRVRDRFRHLGEQIMHRSGGGGPFQTDVLGSIVSDSGKRALVAGLLGQAFVVAYNTIRHNRAGTEQIADVLVARRELHGDEVVEVLDAARLSKPQIDMLDEAAWPVI